jgi:hypothetical protein
LVAVESITANDHGTYSLEANGQYVANLDVSGIADRLKVSPRYVSSITAALASLESNEIIQSGGVLKIADPKSDTHGVLHVDSTCSEAQLLDGWSKRDWSASNPGPYTRLRSLGGGWYYYVEQR